MECLGIASNECTHHAHHLAKLVLLLHDDGVDVDRKQERNDEGIQHDGQERCDIEWRYLLDVRQRLRVREDLERRVVCNVSICHINTMQMMATMGEN